jgi:hypothetical protein
MATAARGISLIWAVIGKVADSLAKARGCARVGAAIARY